MSVYKEKTITMSIREWEDVQKELEALKKYKGDLREVLQCIPKEDYIIFSEMKMGCTNLTGFHVESKKASEILEVFEQKVEVHKKILIDDFERYKRRNYKELEELSNYSIFQFMKWKKEKNGKHNRKS